MVEDRTGGVLAELGEGPCLHAAHTGERVLLPDLAAREATERFPRFAAQALAAGIGAVYSFPLCAADQHVGGLSLYNAAPGRARRRRRAAPSNGSRLNAMTRGLSPAATRSRPSSRSNPSALSGTMREALQ